jgi:hypothetical protein
MVNATSHHSHPRSIHSQSTVNATTITKQRHNSPFQVGNNPNQSTNNAKQSINFKKQRETRPQLVWKGVLRVVKEGVRSKEAIPGRESDRENTENLPGA